LVCLFPVILIERFLLKWLDPEESIEPMIVHGSLTGVWIVVAGVLFLQVSAKGPRAKPKKPVELEPDLSGVEAEAAGAPLELDPWPEETPALPDNMPPMPANMPPMPANMPPMPANMPPMPANIPPVPANIPPVPRKKR
jgi:hypothetical protein